MQETFIEATGNRSGMLGLDVSILFAKLQKDIKGFEAKSQYVGYISTDYRQEDQLEDY